MGPQRRPVLEKYAAGYVEAISKIPILLFAVFSVQTLLFFLHVLGEYALQKTPRLNKKSYQKSLKPIFEVASSLQRSKNSIGSAGVLQEIVFQSRFNGPAFFRTIEVMTKF